MKLNAFQRSQVRKIVALSTMLTDMRYSVYENWKVWQERLKDARLARLKAEGALRIATANCYHSDPVSRAEFLAPAKEAVDNAADHERGCLETFGDFSRQLENMTPEVARAQRLAEQLLGYAGIDKGGLTPVAQPKYPSILGG